LASFNICRCELNGYGKLIRKWTEKIQTDKVVFHVHYESPDRDAEPTVAHFKNYAQRMWGDRWEESIHRGIVDAEIISPVLSELVSLPVRRSSEP